MGKPKLIIMVGNIVSGKSTWIKKFLKTEQGKDFVVLSKDDLRRMLGAGNYLWDENIEQAIQVSLIDLLQNFMLCNKNIILDETNMNLETREAYFCLTKKRKSYGYNYEIIAVVMPQLPFDRITHRIKFREGLPEWGDFPREVWEGVWKRKNSKFEMPTLEEGFDKVYVIGGIIDGMNI